MISLATNMIIILTKIPSTDSVIKKGNSNIITSSTIITATTVVAAETLKKKKMMVRYICRTSCIQTAKSSGQAKKKKQKSAGVFLALFSWLLLYVHTRLFFLSCLELSLKLLLTGLSLLRAFNFCLYMFHRYYIFFFVLTLVVELWSSCLQSME